MQPNFQSQEIGYLLIINKHYEDVKLCFFPSLIHPDDIRLSIQLFNTEFYYVQEYKRLFVNQVDCIAKKDLLTRN